MAAGHIGTRIKTLRESRGMSRKQLGSILGMSELAVQGIESGRNDNLRADKIKLVCETFHEHPGFLLYGRSHDHWKKLLPSKAESEEQASDGLAGSNIPFILKRAIEDFVGKDALYLLENIKQLNAAGQNRARTLIDNLLKIREYRKSL